MRAVAALTFLAGITFAVAAQPPAQPPGTFVPWANKLFQKDGTPPVLVHDFGTVPHGTLLVHKMTVTNIYDIPLQVIGVRESCTCLKSVPPTQVLMPNESAEVVLTMDAGKFTGPNAQSFFITFGPQYTSTAVIRVQANSRADVTLTPGRAAFGVVPVGAAPSQTVSVKYTGKQRDWRITGAVQPAGPLDVRVAETGKREFAVTVGLKDDAPPGPIDEAVTLATNDPTAPTLVLRVSATVQASVTVSPGSVRFSGVKAGEEQTQKVVLRATRPFRVEPAADPGDGVSAETFPAAAPVQIVTVKFAPKAAGAVRRTIPLKTTLDGATATVTVDATAVEPGR